MNTQEILKQICNRIERMQDEIIQETKTEGDSLSDFTFSTYGVIDELDNVIGIVQEYIE